MGSYTRRQSPKSRRSWSDLPEIALRSITQFTDSRFDIIHLRAVCSNWRKHVPPPPKPSQKLPMLLYTCNVNHCVAKGRPVSVYKLYKTTVFLLEEPESSKKWLVTISERSFENKVCLLNPFTSRDLGKYFPKYAFPNRILDLLDFRITQVSTRYNMRLIGALDEDKNRESQNLELDLKLVDESKLKYDVFHKAEISDEFSKIDSFFIITHLSKLRNLTFNGNVWTAIGGRANYCDIVLHNDFFYCVNRNGVVIAIYYNSYELERVIRPPLSFVGEWYLVKAGGDLYLVGRDFRVCDRQVHYSHKAGRFVAKSRSGPIPVVFHIFVLNVENPLALKWVEVPNLNGYIFFVSRNASFAIEAAACNLCEGNSIIFVDEIKYVDESGGGGGGRDHHNVPQENKYAIKQLGGVKVGVYNVVEGTNLPLSQCPNQLIQMFWPPPEWLALMSTGSCSSPSSSSSSSFDDDFYF